MRTFPLLACGRASDKFENIAGIWPATTSASAGALPLYATWIISRSACLRKSAIDRWFKLPVPPRTIRELTLSRAHVVDKFLQGLDGNVLVDDQHEWVGRNDTDRREVFLRVIPNLCHSRHDRHDRKGGDEQRIAIRPCTCCHLGRNCPAGTGAILDHKRLPERFAQTLSGHPGNRIGVAAGRERNDDGHRPLWPDLGLRLRRSRSSDQRAN